MADFIDHYEILGVIGGASEFEIKKHWRVLAKALDPRQNDGKSPDPEKWAKVSASYKVLGDTEARTAYEKTWRTHNPGAVTAMDRALAAAATITRRGSENKPPHEFYDDLCYNNILDKLLSYPSDPRLLEDLERFIEQDHIRAVAVDAFVAKNAEQSDAVKRGQGYQILARIIKGDKIGHHLLRHSFDAMILDGSLPDAQALFMASLNCRVSSAAGDEFKAFYNEAASSEAVFAAALFIEKHPEHANRAREKLILNLAYNPTHPANVKMFELLLKADQLNSGYWLCALDEAYAPTKGQDPDKDIALAGHVRSVMKKHPALVEGSRDQLAKYTCA